MPFLTEKYFVESKYIPASGYWGEGLNTSAASFHFFDAARHIHPSSLPFFIQEKSNLFDAPQQYGMVSVTIVLDERGTQFDGYTINIGNYDDSWFGRTFDTADDAIRMFRALEQTTQDELFSELGFD